MKKDIRQALLNMTCAEYMNMYSNDAEKAYSALVEVSASAIRISAISDEWDRETEKRFSADLYDVASLVYILFREKAEKEYTMPQEISEKGRTYWINENTPSALLILYRAAFHAVNRHWRENYKRPCAALFQTDSEGNEFCIIDTLSFNRPCGFNSPESMIYKVTIEQERKGGRLTDRDEKAALQIMEYNTRISNTCIGSGAKMVRFVKRMKKTLSDMEG